MNTRMMSLVMAGGLLAAGAAGAAEPGWTTTVTPYVWMAGLSGDVGVGESVSSVDEDFSDLVDKLELALMMGLEFRHGAWGIFLDGMYMDLEDEEETAAGAVTVGVRQGLVSAGGLYRVLDNDALTLDLGAGGRFIDTRLEIDTPLGSADGSTDWIDPILVARLRCQVARKIFLALTGDIGGFGAESDLVWQLTAAAGYEFNEWMSLQLGYRHLDYDYEDDVFVYDVATSGFGIGMSFRY